MFGYIPQSQFDDEKARRERAERRVIELERELAAASELAGERKQMADDYRELYREEVAARRQDRELFKEQNTTLLNHLAPVATASGSDPGTPLKPVTSKDVKNQPAVSKREQRQRRREVEDLTEQEREQEHGAVIDAGKKRMTEDERKEVEFDTV